MKGIQWQGTGALLVAALLGCGGGSPEETERALEQAAASSQTAQTAVTRSAERIGADDPDTTTPQILRVSLQPNPPEPGEVIRAVAEVKAQGGYSLSYVWDVAGQTIRNDRGAIELPKLGKGQTVSVRVVAANAAGESEPVSAEASVENTEPTIMDLQIEEKLSSEGKLEAWEARAWARDPDGDPVEIRYTWILNNRPTDVETAFYPVAELKRGDRLRVRVIASDGEDESDAGESGTFEIGNTAPKITSTPPRLDATGLFSYQIEATDADGDRSLHYQLVKGPRGMQIHAFKGMLTWRPEVDQSGKHEVEIAVDDRNGGRSTQSFRIPVVTQHSAGPPAAMR